MTISQVAPIGNLKVSVFMATYNHERYIREAIEGVLAQETQFGYELVIGEDCSTDGTRAICRSYAEKFPEKIVLLLRDQNIGAFHNGSEIYRRCRGEFIALCEGDDYWTHPQKLQKQVSAMEAHPNWSGCCHRSIEFIDGDVEHGKVFPRGKVPDEITFESLIDGNKMHTCSVMYRRGVVPEMPKWFQELTLCDWPFHLLHAMHGPIGFLDEVMSAYRIHSNGMWSSLSDGVRQDLTLKAMYIMESHFPEPSRTIFRLHRQEWIGNLLRIRKRYHALGLDQIDTYESWIKRQFRRLRWPSSLFPKSSKSS